MIRLKELRKAHKLTQQQLADIVGVTKRTIIAWEKEEREIKKENLKTLSSFFNVSPGFLLGYTDIEKQYEDEVLAETTKGVRPVSPKRIRDENFLKFIEFLKDIHVFLSDEQIINIFRLIESMNIFNKNNFVGDFINYKIGTPIDERTFYNSMAKFGYSYMMDTVSEEEEDEFTNLFKDLN